MIRRLLPSAFLLSVSSRGSITLNSHLRQWIFNGGDSISTRSLRTSVHKFQQTQNSETEKSPKLTVEQQAEEFLSSLDPERAKKLKVIQLEADMLQHMGAMVPDTFLASWWVNLLDLETPSARRKYYKYLRKIENVNMSKERRRLERAQLRAEREKDKVPITEPRNTIFMQIRKSAMNNFYNSRLAHAMMFGPEIIIDMDYENLMQNRESVNLGDQLQMSISANRQDREPFHMIFTSVTSSNRTMLAMNKSSQERSLAQNLFTVTDQSYLDLYPKDRLVYLTPNAPDDLVEFSYGDVYIVGGLVDKTYVKPISMAKAKEQKIRMAKFPLDQYLLWCKGGKSLTIDQVFKILLDLKSTKSWESAFRHVPRRKVLELPVRNSRQR